MSSPLLGSPLRVSIFGARTGELWVCRYLLSVDRERLEDPNLSLTDTMWSGKMSEACIYPWVPNRWTTEFWLELADVPRHVTHATRHISHPFFIFPLIHIHFFLFPLIHIHHHCDLSLAFLVTAAMPSTPSHQRPPTPEATRPKPVDLPTHDKGPARGRAILVSSDGQHFPVW